MLLKLKRKDKEDNHKCQTTVYLNGGLGNQLFQLAHGIEISRSRNSTLVLDTSLLILDKKRKYALDLFEIPSDVPLECSNSGLNLTSQLSACYCESKQISESHFFYNDFSDRFPSPSKLEIRGYWQSQKYFENSSNFIKALIDVHLKSFSDKKFGVMHIRRGDFLSDSRTRDFHGVLGHPYYLKACKLIPNEVKKIFLISDDLSEANQILQELSKRYPEIEFLLFLGASNELDCLSLMADSNFVVTANSSFSWWGAWLSTADTIVAPRNYFAQETARVNNLVDLYPENWHLA